MTAADALAGFLRALGVPGQDIPPEVGERAALYRSLLAGRRILVVADNSGSVEQARPLLPGSPSCAAVVTSRDALAGLVARDGARRLDLDLLPAAEAVGLLRALIGARVDADPGAAAAAGPVMSPAWPPPFTAIWKPATTTRRPPPSTPTPAMPPSRSAIASPKRPH